MIRNVLVSIIKETDYIRTDVKYLKEIRVPGDHIDWSFDENRER